MMQKYRARPLPSKIVEAFQLTRKLAAEYLIDKKPLPINRQCHTSRADWHGDTRDVKRCTVRVAQQMSENDTEENYVTMDIDEWCVVDEGHVDIMGEVEFHHTYVRADSPDIACIDRLTDDENRQIVRRIFNLLYVEDGEITTEKDWDSMTFSGLIEILDSYNLIPEESEAL